MTSRFSRSSVRVLPRPVVCKSDRPFKHAPPNSPTNIFITIDVQTTDAGGSTQITDARYIPGIPAGQPYIYGGIDDNGFPWTATARVDLAPTRAQIDLLAHHHSAGFQNLQTTTPGWTDTGLQSEQSSEWTPDHWAGTWSWETP